LNFRFDFKPREAFYLTFDQGKYTGNGKRSFEQTSSVTSNLSNITLNDGWKFMAFNNEKVERWTDEIVFDTIDIPVMKFYSEVKGVSMDNLSDPGYNDSHWPLVKLYDRYNKRQRGGERYLSSWNSSCIINDTRPTCLEFLEQDAEFRKNFTLAAKPFTASIKLRAKPAYRLIVNGTMVGEAGNTDFTPTKTYDIAKYLRVGENVLVVKVPKNQGLLAEGEVVTGKETIHLNTNESWKVKADTTSHWSNAFVVSKPPLGKLNKLQFELSPEFPIVGWYRQAIPVGTRELILPYCEGSYEYYLNGEKIIPAGNTIAISKKFEGKTVLLAVKVTFSKLSDGLSKPIRAVQTPMQVAALCDWSTYGLGWFSGRAIYTTEFKLHAEYLKNKEKLILDLGNVGWFAEIWINHKLVKFFPWGDFSADISQYLQEGSNQVSVIVSNLSANREYWDVPDDALASSFSRWHHNVASNREKERLESGLWGPVRIIPQSR
jgi:hypothetical protein